MTSHGLRVTRLFRVMGKQARVGVDPLFQYLEHTSVQHRAPWRCDRVEDCLPGEFVPRDEAAAFDA
jgi:hypothetical protein